MKDSRNSEGVISYPISTLLRGEEGPWVHTLTTFSYDKSDPFAVSTTFGNETDAPATWTWARELLYKGVDEPTGEADVIVYPGKLDDVHGHTAIHFSGPEGEVTLYARTAPVAEFIARTLSLVPVERESENLDIDTVLAQILS